MTYTLTTAKQTLNPNGGLTMTRKPRILLADDDQPLLQALKVRLESLNVEIITATDGYTSLAKAVSEKPDLLILDINMPAGDGFSVQERLRETSDGLEDTPTIYLTGDHSERLDQIASQMGAFAIHHKPFKVQDLVNDIHEALKPKAA